MLMLVGGLCLFLSGYGVYTFFLGGIDGLPPLPADYFPPAANASDPWGKDATPESLREHMIRQAFGAASEELHRPIRLLVRDKGMVLSAGQFSIEEDGRVKFSPF